MSKFNIILIVFFGVLSQLNAQSVTIKTDNGTGVIRSLDLADNNLDLKFYKGDLTAVLDQTFDDMTGMSDITGFSAAIILPDGTIWKRAAGRSISSPFPQNLETDHLLGMGSITKSFVSTTLMLLVEDGLISLDDPLNKFLPDYQNIDGNITVRQILSHTSGINDFLNENAATNNAWANNLDHIWTIDEVLNNYVLEPNFAPGTSYSYSNTGFLLAGKLIEVITGRNWYELVRERIIDPLGLESTFAYPWESRGTKTLAHAFFDLDGNGTVEDAQGQGINLDGLFSLASSAGCLISTPEDIATFNKKLFTGEIVNPTSLAAMQTDLTMGVGGLIYGLGVGSFPVGIENWGHNGSLIYNSFGLYFPTENISIAIQQNDARLNGAGGLQIVDIYTVFLGLLESYLNYVPVSTNDLTLSEKAFHIFPNPSQGFININIDNEVDLSKPLPLELIDLQGKTIIKSAVESHNSMLQIRGLNAGFYFLKMGQIVHKLIIE